MIAPNDTHFRLGLGPGGLHGYDHNYTLPRTGWRPSTLGKYQPMSFPIPYPMGDAESVFNTIINDATGAFESTQRSAELQAIYGGQNGPPPPGTIPAAAGSISFGGNTGTILIVLGIAAAVVFGGGRRRK